MNTKNKQVIRWPLVAVYLGIVAVLVACATVGSVTATPAPTEAAALHLENGAVEVQDESGSWIPVTGEATFELVGELEGTDPWKVTGNTFANSGLNENH